MSRHQDGRVQEEENIWGADPVSGRTGLEGLRPSLLHTKSEIGWWKRRYCKQNELFVIVWVPFLQDIVIWSTSIEVNVFSTSAWSKFRTEGKTSHKLTTHLHTHKTQVEEKECIRVLQGNRINRGCLKNKELVYAVWRLSPKICSQQPGGPGETMA